MRVSCAAAPLGCTHFWWWVFECLEHGLDSCSCLSIPSCRLAWQRASLLQWQCKQVQHCSSWHRLCPKVRVLPVLGRCCIPRCCIRAVTALHCTCSHMTMPLPPHPAARVGGSQQQRQSRRLSAVPAVTLGGPQTCFQPGASVYDASQHGQRRGYGIIDRRAADADDGTRKWYVQWDSAAPGSRCTAISETYLRLSHIHHSSRVSPTGLQQPIVVMVGTYKGKAGVTEQKVGSQGVVYEAALGGQSELQCRATSTHACMQCLLACLLAQDSSCSRLHT